MRGIREKKKNGKVVGWIAQPSFKGSREGMPQKTFPLDQKREAEAYVQMYYDAARKGALRELKIKLETKDSLNMEKLWKAACSNPNGWAGNKSQVQQENARRFCAWFGWEENPLSISRDVLRDFRDFRADESMSCSNSTMNRYFSAINVMLQYGVDEEWYDERDVINPNRLRMKEDHSGRTREALSEEETNALKEAVKEYDAEHQLFLLMLLYYGRRVGEILQMEYRDVCLDMGEEGAFRFENFKNNGARNEVHIPIFPQVRKALDLYLKERGGSAKTAPLWTYLRSQWKARSFVRSVATLANVERDLTPHWLRHTCLTRLVDAGATPRQVQQFAGHKHLSTTEKYFHGRPEVFRGLSNLILNFENGGQKEVA